MVTAQQHLYLAERNERFAETIAALPDRFFDWEVTTLFYSALHYVSAYLATLGHHPSSHHQRGVLVNNLTAVWDEYQNLFLLSMAARYYATPITIQQADEAKDYDFRRVKEEMLALLAGQTNREE